MSEFSVVFSFILSVSSSGTDDKAYQHTVFFRTLIMTNAEFAYFIYITEQSYFEKRKFFAIIITITNYCVISPLKINRNNLHRLNCRIVNHIQANVLVINRYLCSNVKNTLNLIQFEQISIKQDSYLELDVCILIYLQFLPILYTEIFTRFVECYEDDMAQNVIAENCSE